jgi:hypothetical protein
MKTVLPPVRTAPSIARGQSSHRASSLVTWAIPFALAALLALPARAQTGPTVTLNYRGEIEGLPATARIGFEDTRSGINPPGFFLAGGRPAWARKNALIGRILLGGEVATPTAQYTFFGEVVSTSDFGYMDVTLTGGFERFRVRLDLTADADFVYIDRFDLVVNPFDPPTVTTYRFQLDIPTAKVTRLVLSPDGTVTVHWEGSPNSTCRLLAKDDILAPTWTFVGQTVMTANTATLEDRTARGIRQRYYSVETVLTGQ